MATKEYWLQIEDHTWNTHPWVTSQAAMQRDNGDVDPAGLAGQVAVGSPSLRCGLEPPRRCTGQPWTCSNLILHIPRARCRARCSRQRLGMTS